MKAEVLGFHPAFSSRVGLRKKSMLVWHRQLLNANHSFIRALLGKAVQWCLQWLPPGIPVCRRLEQVDDEFQTSLGYTGRP